MITRTGRHGCSYIHLVWSLPIDRIQGVDRRSPYPSCWNGLLKPSSSSDMVRRALMPCQRLQLAKLGELGDVDFENFGLSLRDSFGGKPATTVKQLPSVVAIDLYRPRTVSVELPIIRYDTFLGHETIALQCYFFAASDFRKSFLRNSNGVNAISAADGYLDRVPHKAHLFSGSECELVAASLQFNVAP